MRNTLLSTALAYLFLAASALATTETGPAGGGGGSGTVTSIATTGPITGGPISTTGTVGCTTCATTTNGGALTATAPMAISAGGVISISNNVNLRTIGVTADGAGKAPATGVIGYYRVPYSGTITGYTLLASASGSCVIDIWKAAGAIPTVANTITASALPTLSSQQFVNSTTLTGWTTSVSAGDVIGYNINSASTLTRVTLQLNITTN